MILSTSLRPFVSVGAWVFFFPALQVDSCLRYPPFQNTRGLIAKDPGGQHIKFALDKRDTFGNIFRKRSLLCSAAFANRSQSKCVSLCHLHGFFFFGVCVRVCVWQVAAGEFVLAGHLERFRCTWHGGSRRCLWRASLSTSSSATLPLQQGFPHTNGWIFLWASIANH